MTTYPAHCDVVQIEGGQLLIHEGRGVTTVELRTGLGWRMAGPFSREKGGNLGEGMVIHFGPTAERRDEMDKGSVKNGQ